MRESGILGWNETRGKRRRRRLAHKNKLLKKTFALACFAIFIPFAFAYADQGGFTNSRGTLTGGTSVANPPGTLTIVRGTLTFLSTDGTTAIDAALSNSSTVESCSGGGRGGHVTCGFTFRALSAAP
jgi:hypothetical protein